MPPKEEKVLTQHAVNLKILAKDEVVHSDCEILSVSGRYREEDYEIYKKKRRQFNDSAREYKDLNVLALKTNMFKTDIEGDARMKFEFLEKIDECIPTPFRPGTLIRKRTLRPIHTEFQGEVVVPRTLEPWFRRYLVLGRFIQVVRKLIVKTRMLKRLEVLKLLTPEIVEQIGHVHLYVVNESYPKIFEKFI